MYIAFHEIIIKPRRNLLVSLFFLLIFVFNFTDSFAQVKSIRLGNLSIEQGLSQSTAECMAQDSSGFLWIGTQDGLNRYDGYNFVVYKPMPDDSLSISDNYIRCLYVDKYGKMWIGTDNGLNEYNPSFDSFTAFKSKHSDSLSISSNTVTTITGDAFGNLWVGTDNGLNYFDRSKNVFVHYLHNDNDKSSLSNNSINTSFIDSENRLWIGTANNLDLFDPKTRTFKHYLDNSQEKNLPINDGIYSIAGEQSGNLWIGTYHGLYKFNVNNNTFTHFKHSISDNKSISSDSIRVVYVDKNGVIWLGTQNNGLNYYDPVSGIFRTLESSVVNFTNSSDKQVRSLLQDREGLLWIGTFTSGVYKYNERKKLFGLIKIDDQPGNNLEENDISAIYKDQNNNIWIGSFYAGVIKLDEKTGKYINYKHSSSSNSLIHNFINVIFADQKGFIWIGTTEGLDKFDPRINKFYHFKHESENINSLGANYINAITNDDAGNLWVGLIGGGMDMLNSVANKFAHFKHDPLNSNSISSNEVNYLFFDNEGTLWIGTNGSGLDRFNPKTGNFKHYIHDANNQKSLCNNVVLDIYEFPGDASGTLWSATAGGGISKLNKNTGHFDNYSEKDGLANNEVYGILGDKNGNLWSSTNNGISKFNIFKQTFRNYNQSDGLQSNEFNQGAFFQGKDGKMYFGGKSGINAFFPDSIKHNSYDPQVVFTSFKAYNKPINLNRSIWKTDQIELSYKDNILSFTFAALSYNDPDKNKFAYMLKGLNDNWINKNTNGEVTFTNLPPGKYTLLVKGTNNDGLWSSHIASINIIILPPFWQTWWFRTIIALVLIALVYFIIEFRMRAIQQRNKKLEVVVSERTKELHSKKEELEKVNFKQAGLLEMLTKSETELKELNRHKDKIISVLAHDLRSPFHGLLGYTDLLANEIDELEEDEIKESARNINNAANSLYKLLNNLLDWSLVQAGKIKYSPMEENLLQCVNEAIHLIKVNAEQKSILLTTNIDDKITVWADRNMLDIIFRNLISNAIKFTKTGGEVNIYSNVLEFNDKQKVGSEKSNTATVEIGIRDNGVGMEENVLASLLSPDSQITPKGTNNETGTGLGLNLCKELIEKQGGKIKIESKLEKEL